MCFFFLSSYVFVLSVLLRLSTAFEFDETFPVLCHVSLFLTLSLSHPSLLSFSLGYHLFLPIPLHPYCQCNSRYSVKLSLFAPTLSSVPLAIVDPATLSNSVKMLPCFLLSTTVTFPHLFRIGYNSAEHLPFGFHSLFLFAPSARRLTLKTIRFSNLAPPRQILYNVPKDTWWYFRELRVIIFSSPSRNINKMVLKGTRASSLILHNIYREGCYENERERI